VGEHLPLDAHFAIGNFIRSCLNDEPIVIQGDGTPLRSYLYTGDLAHWLWGILLHGENGRIYNVGGNYVVSIEEVARIVKKVAKTSNEIQILSSPSGFTQCYAPNIRRVSKELGLNVEVSLEEAIKRTIEYHKMS
jgi:dTDP-glucose 4,6-dehydratase